MDIRALKKGIYNVFDADTDLKTALGGTAERFYNTKIPQNPDYPCAVYFFTGGSIDMTFDKIVELTTWQFSIFHYDKDDPLNTETIDDVFKKMGAAYDDSESSMTVSGYSVTWVTRGASGALPTEDLTQQYFLNYEIRMEKAR